MRRPLSFLVVMAIALTGCIQDPPSARAPAAPAVPTMQGAVDAVPGLATPHLKLLGDEDFSENVTVQRLNKFDDSADPAWRIKGTLDRTNESGIYSQRRYHADVEFHTPSRRWRLTWLVVDDETYYEPPERAESFKAFLDAVDAAERKKEI